MGAGVLIAISSGMDEETFEPFASGSFDGDSTIPGVAAVVEVSNEREFMEALVLRLNEIVRKPIARYVVTYVSGQPGARRRPSVR
jgi:hypothetical protein